MLELTWSSVMPLSAQPEPDAAETSLVEASREGDQDAFAVLVHRHERRVFRLASRFFRRREDVEEAAQETFLTAWRKLHTYRARAPFEHWLTRVCLNTCYGRLRAARPEGQELFESDGGVADASPDARIDAERLLARLPPDDRFILLLLHGEGWTAGEIAEKLGWTAVNVKVRAHRARKRLRRALEGEGS